MKEDMLISCLSSYEILKYLKFYQNERSQRRKITYRYCDTSDIFKTYYILCGRGRGKRYHRGLILSEAEIRYLKNDLCGGFCEKVKSANYRCVVDKDITQMWPQI